MDDDEPRVLGWVHRHTNLLWGVIGLIFLIYGVNALVHWHAGTVGPDYSNVISTFGGIIAAIAAAVLAIRGARERRREGDDDA